MIRFLRSKRIGWPARGLSLCLLASISWSVHHMADPLHGTSWEDLNLNGNVREVRVEEAPIASNGTSSREGSRSPVEWIVFDNEGHVVEWVEIGSRGDAESTRYYIYEDGRLRRQEEYGRWSWPSETIVYTHEGDGMRTTAEVLASDGSLRKTVVYERDADGKLLSVTESDDDGAEISHVVYTYSGTTERADRYDPDGELISWSLETFDASGLLSKIELHTAASDDAPFAITYEYDEHGNVSIETTSGRLAMPIVVMTTTPSETKTRYEYIYDDAGNWTKRVTSIWVANDEPYWRPTRATYRALLYEE